MLDYRILRLFGIIVFVFASLLLMRAQDNRRDLEFQRERLEQEIQENLQTIEKLKKSKKTISQEVFLLEKNIRNRQKILDAINKELAMMDQQIVDVSAKINKTEQDLNHQREDYVRLILAFQKNYRQYDWLQFILSAESFNQAFLRFQYYRQYKDYLRQEIEKMRQTNERLGSQMAELSKAREARSKIIERQQKEIAKLSTDKEQKNRALAKARAQEDELRKEVERKKQSLQLISRTIKKIIEEEAALSAKRAKELSKNEVKPNDLGILYSPEDLQLSGEFKSLKGHLPWPVEKGLVSESFGEHPHPVLKGIRVKNNGITITTEKGASVKAVFGGKVSKIIRISNHNQVVILRHGQFLTVYSELSEVKVIEGQQVKAGDIVGMVDSKDNWASVHFEVWNQKTPEDPASWLKQ